MQFWKCFRADLERSTNICQSNRTEGRGEEQQLGIPAYITDHELVLRDSSDNLCFSNAVKLYEDTQFFFLDPFNVNLKKY